MTGWRATLSLGIVLLVPAGLRAQETTAEITEEPTAKSVTNGTHAVEVIRVEKQELLAGVFTPATPNSVYLVVYVRTDDPALDPEKGSLNAMTEACGTIATEESGVIAADGGGLMAGELSCAYVVPSGTAGTVELHLDGYPTLELQVE